MKPLLPDQIYGNWATLLLPIQADDSVDYNRLQTEIDFLTSVGVDGIYSNGTAGEFYTQSEEEFRRIQEMFAQGCQEKKVPFQIGASHMSAQEMIKRIKFAKSLGPSAIQVILADWFPLSDHEVLDCLVRLAEEADPVGIVLYNPPHAKRIVAPEMYALIKERVPNLVSIKVAGGDDHWYEDMQRHLKDIAVFVPGHHLASGVVRGAAGSYSNVACLNPVAAQQWFDMMHTDIDRALELEKRIQQFMNQYIQPFIEQKYCNAALDKLIASIGNWCDIGTRLRWPYRWIAEEEAVRLRPIAKDLLPEFFPDNHT